MEGTYERHNFSRRVGHQTLSAMWHVSRQSDITDFYDCRGNWIRQHKNTLSRVNGKRKKNTICEEQMCT